MFEKEVTTTFSDPHGGQIEFEKHRDAATSLLGADPLILNSTTTPVPLLDDNGKEVGYIWQLTTLWKSRT